MVTPPTVEKYVWTLQLLEQDERGLFWYVPDILFLCSF